MSDKHLEGGHFGDRGVEAGQAGQVRAEQIDRLHALQELLAKFHTLADKLKTAP